MKVESDIAAFLGTMACIIYAQAFSTISSVIPAFSKRGDIIVADKGVNYAIRKGMQISRSTIRWYEHNDMEDLQRVLAKVTKEQARKPLTRRFIITEGLFETSGEMADLPKVVRMNLACGDQDGNSGNAYTWRDASADFFDLEFCADRIEAEIQMPADSGRDIVVWSIGSHGARAHRTSTRGCG